MNVVTTAVVLDIEGTLLDHPNGSGMVRVLMPADAASDLLEALKLVFDEEGFPDE